MKLFTILVLLALTAATASAQVWYTNPANGHQYAELTPYLSWEDSEAQAISLGGHLVTINDAAENEWVRSTFSVYNFDWMWIGLSEIQPYDPNNRQWAWSSGETPVYLNWAPGEPSSSAEHHVAMEGVRFWNGQWADLSTPWSQPVVQIGAVEVESVPEPDPIMMLIVVLLVIGLVIFVRSLKGKS